jgi:hypothetical protein
VAYPESVPQSDRDVADHPFSIRNARWRTQLTDRISLLEAAARRITVSELDALTAEVERGRKVKAERARLEPFWTVNLRGIKPSSEETSALELLWTLMLVGLAEGLTGRDVAAGDARAAEGTATSMIEHSGAAANPWAGVTAIWNASCAVLLQERLSPAIRAELLSTWRKVLGDEPGSRLVDTGQNVDHRAPNGGRVTR